MLKTLRISNFKGWKDTGEIHFSPITLFLGSNSSGKSSIGQFLMLLKQSANSADRQTVLFLGSSDSYVELGGPVDMLYMHNPKNLLDFEYHWTLPKPITLTMANDDANADDTEIDSLSFHGQIGVFGKDTNYLEVESMKYAAFRHKQKLLAVALERTEKGSSARAYKAVTDSFKLVRTSGRPWEIPSPYRFYGFPDEMLTYYKNAWLTAQLNAAQEQFFSRISYLGPLREKGERHYRWTGFAPASVGATGKDTILALLASRTQNRSYNFKPKQPLCNMETIVAKSLKEMGLVEEFEIRKVTDDRQDYDVKVRTKGSKTMTDIPDVGFGISQILPVIVQLYYAPANSIIIMEQPELHLHPSAQSALADVMIAAISARENAKPRNIQLIIETHSEHFLRRFQRRIAEKKLAENNFSAYFANNDRDPARLEALTINLFGEIENWPKNFFGDIKGDIFAQTEAALNQ
ncbi:MAG: DUF3696 domain-containing protein [Succinivibrionaceae bacterium]|nr:DUF3696 domain-containing protein [Succinivibrionaceae bacterium]